MNDGLIFSYLTSLSDIIQQIPREPLAAMIDVLKRAQQDQKRIFVFGNGGSAATASHIVCDLVKNTARAGQTGLAVFALNDNMATFSAYANDEGYETVFARPLQTMAGPGDIALAISGSGNSPNVLHALRVAAQLGMIRLGLTGGMGGKLKDLVEICAIVPTDNIQYIEDAHLAIGHILTRALAESVSSPASVLTGVVSPGK